MWREKASVLDLYDMRHWSERTVIALVMQTLDNSITTFTKRNPVTGRRYLTSKQGHGRPEPDLDPGRQRGRAPDGRRCIGGNAGGSIGEPFNRPLTAHFIGGCTIGDSARDRA